MNIKRIIAIIIASIILLLTLVFRCISFTSVATQISTQITTSAIEVSTIPTTQPTTAPPKPVFDETVIYINLDSRSEIDVEVIRCNEYLLYLNDWAGFEGIDEEIIRVNTVLEQYNYDLEYLDRTIINVPDKYNCKDFKSYEHYKAITIRTSPHYKLQKEYAYTGEDGCRMVNDRYCIALGSYFETRIGQYIDIVLANGTVIPCILGDQKADKHTDDLHITHCSDGSIIEFIVDMHELPYKVHNDHESGSGNMSDCYKEWKSPVIQVIVYDINEFDK